MFMYSFEISTPRYFRLDKKTILQVVPEPHMRSKTRPSSLLQDSIWSCASFSGKVTGCSKVIRSEVVPPRPTA
jgi:hypothetical protein